MHAYALRARRFLHQGFLAVFKLSPDEVYISVDYSIGLLNRPCLLRLCGPDRARAVFRQGLLSRIA